LVAILKPSFSSTNPVAEILVGHQFLLKNTRKMHLYMYTGYSCCSHLLFVVSAVQGRISNHQGGRARRLEPVDFIIAGRKQQRLSSVSTACDFERCPGHGTAVATNEWFASFPNWLLQPCFPSIPATVLSIPCKSRTGQDWRSCWEISFS
jgi:hypothetical protein